METKKEEQEESRFSYSDESGLKLLSEKDILDSIDKKEEVLEKSEKIEGGLADNKSIEDIAKKHGVSVSKIIKELNKGIDIEKEHTDDEEKATEIAKDHLMEISDYYTRLDKMEKQAKND